MSQFPYHDPSWALQQGIYARLATVFPRIYDASRENPTFPYVVVDLITAIPANTYGNEAYECTVTLSMMSRYPGKKEASEMIGQAIVALTDGTVAVTGWAIIGDAVPEYRDVTEEDNGLTRHGLLRVRLTLQHAA